MLLPYLTNGTKSNSFPKRGVYSPSADLGRMARRQQERLCSYGAPGAEQKSGNRKCRRLNGGLPAGCPGESRAEPETVRRRTGAGSDGTTKNVRGRPPQVTAATTAATACSICMRPAMATVTECSYRSRPTTAGVDGHDDDEMVFYVSTDTARGVDDDTFTVRVRRGGRGCPTEIPEVRDARSPTAGFGGNDTRRPTAEPEVEEAADWLCQKCSRISAKFIKDFVKNKEKKSQSSIGLR